MLFVKNNRSVLVKGGRDTRGRSVGVKGSSTRRARGRGSRRRGRETIIEPIKAPNDILSRFEPILNSTETNEPVYHVFDENSSSLPDFPSYLSIHDTTQTLNNQQTTYSDWFGTIPQSNTTLHSHGSVASSLESLTTAPAVTIKRRVGRHTKAETAARK